MYQEWYLKAPWFSGTPANAKSASIEIGDGTNGKVTVTCDKKGTEGNAYSLEVVVAEGNGKALAAALSGAKITVTLGTDAGGDADVTKNTAKLIATAISKIDGFTAVHSGTGVTAITDAVEEDDFVGGQYGTPCIEPYTVIKGSEYYYICVQGGDSVSTKWMRFTTDDY
jgi:hypothetical protein